MRIVAQTNINEIIRNILKGHHETGFQKQTKIIEENCVDLIYIPDYEDLEENVKRLKHFEMASKNSKCPVVSIINHCRKNNIYNVPVIQLERNDFFECFHINEKISLKECAEKYIGSVIPENKKTEQIRTLIDSNKQLNSIFYEMLLVEKDRKFWFYDGTHRDSALSCEYRFRNDFPYLTTILVN